jgi:hypothetical protein
LRGKNASCVASDFLAVNFAGYDVIAAIECIYYLAAEEAFFQKLTSEAAGKLLIISGPIIGSNEYRIYFTDSGLRRTFA